MKTLKLMKNILFNIFIISFLYTSTLTIADSNHIINDAKDDVIYTDAADIDNTEIVYTDDQPNVDIVKMTYSHPDNSDQATIVLEVDGVIENRNDLDVDDIDPDSMNFSGSVVTYFIELETSYSAYQVEYVNDNCTVNQEEASFTVSGSELSITFDLETSNETYQSIIGYTTKIEIVSLMDMRLYMDIAPNDALFIASISAPFTGNAGDAISFTGDYEDFLGLSTSPYTYTWDWDDGTADGSGKNPNHIYQLPGQYTVTLTVSDGSDYSAEATHTIDISGSDFEPPSVEIIHPSKGLYIFNNQIRRYLLRRPVVFGGIDIQVEATDEVSGIQYVEFFINGEYVHTDFSYPYSYYWSKGNIFKNRYAISVVAFDGARNCGSDMIKLKRYF